MSGSPTAWGFTTSGSLHARTLERQAALRLDHQQHDLGMGGPHTVLDRGDGRLHVGGGETVLEVRGDGGHDLIGTEMDREEAHHALDSRLRKRDRANRGDDV